MDGRRRVEEVIKDCWGNGKGSLNGTLSHPPHSLNHTVQGTKLLRGDTSDSILLMQDRYTRQVLGERVCSLDMAGNDKPGGVVHQDLGGHWEGEDAGEVTEMDKQLLLAVEACSGLLGPAVSLEDAGCTGENFH